MITTKRGTNEWHGEGAFYERAAALNARFPIDNPAPNPKQAFSRQNYVGTLGGPIIKDQLWFFSSFEYVHENASIAYSPASQAQFNALAQLALDGLVSVRGNSISSINAPSSVPVPFRDYLGLMRFDWAPSPPLAMVPSRRDRQLHDAQRSGPARRRLPLTGATSHNNYMNLALGNQFALSPAWLGSLTLDASGLHLTESRNSDLGFALAFPFSSTSSTISGRETFGDNQFITAITAFPVLRNQEKYQVRYDVTHPSGGHAPRFGVNLIHEPVLSGALASTSETLVTLPEGPSLLPGQSCTVHSADIAAGSALTPAGDGSFSQNVQRLGLYAEDSWRVTSRLTINYGVRYTTLLLSACLQRPDAVNHRTLTCSRRLHSDRRLSPPHRTIIARPWPRVLQSRIRSQTHPAAPFLRGGFGMYYTPTSRRTDGSPRSKPSTIPTLLPKAGLRRLPSSIRTITRPTRFTPQRACSEPSTLIGVSVRTGHWKRACTLIAAMISQTFPSFAATIVPVTTRSHSISRVTSPAA